MLAFVSLHPGEVPGMPERASIRSLHHQEQAMMTAIPRSFPQISLIVLTLGCLQPVRAQAPAAPEPPPASPSQPNADALLTAIDGIQQKYDQGLLELGRDRLNQIKKLAEQAPPVIAAQAWEIYFEVAIADNLYGEAEATADQLIAKGDQVAPSVWLLCRIVDLVAKVDRGAYQESVTAIRKALESQPQANAEEEDPALPVPTIVSLLEVYYQRLLHSNQYPIAIEAFQLIRQRSKEPAIQEYLDQRLARLALVGKPAPPIVGTTLEGKPFQLDTLKGKTVLILFWASWCLPNADQADDFLRIFYEFHDKGLEVVGINLDTLQVEPDQIATILPNVNRFLLDYNISWPNLLNGEGQQDFAAAYKITDLPANVLIDPAGNVVNLDADLAGLLETLQNRLGK